MRLFGITIGRAPPVTGTALATVSKDLPFAAAAGGGGWWPIGREPFAGAWQKGIHVRPEILLSHNALFSCITLIASDIGKLRVKLVERDSVGIWREITNPAFSPVLTKPNSYQNRIQFLQHWIISKLTNGNTYVLKERDGRGVVTAMHVLDPTRARPLVAPDGAVYYRLGVDWLAGSGESGPVVPASEIIHDRMNPLFHPLVGISPIFACGLAASQGLNIQRQSAAFFANGARPFGVLTAPGKITREDAEDLRTRWEANYTGDNVGRVAILGNGLAYAGAAVTPLDAQLIDQLKMSSEMVCSTFHVPPWMLGLAELPARIAVEALTQQYYAQCLQVLIESIELCLDEGLGVLNVPGHTYGTELDLDGLLRMDQASQFKAYGDAILAGLMKPDEARGKLDLAPVEGGDQVYLQQQNYSLAALAKRDAQADPFGKANAAPDTAAIKAAFARRWRKAHANARP